MRSAEGEGDRMGEESEVLCFIEGELKDVVGLATTGSIQHSEGGRQDSAEESCYTTDDVVVAGACGVGASAEAVTRAIGVVRARTARRSSAPRRFRALPIVLWLVMMGGALPAWAFPFEDIAAFLQRNAHYILQFRQLLSAARDTRESIMKAYEGIKDWKNLGWVDTLDLVHAPWFDQVDGIEDLRAVTDLTVMNVEQATKLFDDLRDFGSLEHNPRYRRDGWYRSRVDSIRGIARRARAHRVALLRQMQSHNRALSKDTERVRRLRDRIEEESKKEPANQGTISSLQGELAAIQAKHEGENMMMVNQNAIMTLVGAENMDESFLEAVDGDWMGENRRGFREFGRSFSK
jgi:hypothetical protein